MKLHFIATEKAHHSLGLMTFDPDAGRDQFNIYGPLSFSSVPLTVSAPPTDLLPLQKASRTTIT